MSVSEPTTKCMALRHLLKETEDLVKESLEKMEFFLERIRRKEAYDMAKSMSSSYVHDSSLRLKFLRAESFDSRKAATRMVYFFEEMLRYFGPSCLARPLVMNDLSPDDMQALRSAHIQLLSQRDRAGRLVLCDLQAMEMSAFKTVQNMVRAFIYMLLCASEDEDSQKRGIVTLIYQIDAPEGIDNPKLEMAMEGPRVLRWIPLRVTARHMCLDNPVVKAMARLVLASGGKNFRAHYRLHDGSHTEIMYALLGFGIPVSFFPVSSEGSLKKAVHAKWLARRKVLETAREMGETFEGIDIPGRYDVFIGKGNPIQVHSGNATCGILSITTGTSILP